jgi:hypothetical protein
MAILPSWYIRRWLMQRTIILPDDANLRATLAACRTMQQRLSPLAPRRAAAHPHALQRALSRRAGTLSQMTIPHPPGVRRYASAARPAAGDAPLHLRPTRALFLVGAADADFAPMARSIWTVAGRAPGPPVPEAFRATLAAASGSTAER